MERFGTGLVYHNMAQPTPSSARYAPAAWEECFVGVSHFNSDGRKADGQCHICPTVPGRRAHRRFLMEQKLP